MKILVAGVRQKNAPIAVRERFALSAHELDEAVHYLQSIPGIRECALLTTCNRTEIYMIVDETNQGIDSIKQFFRDVKGVDFDLYRLSVFTFLQEDAILHLFRVASGLDSLILGEGQILGQVKEAYARFTNQPKTNKSVILDRLFKTAISVGKRVRTETDIARKDVSVSRSAYDLAKRLVPDFANQRITLIGGGKMATILMSALKHDLSEAQQKNITIVNRSEERLHSLREKYHFQGRSWDDLASVIKESDVLFVATGAPHIVLEQHHFQDSGPKLIIDISVPRNVAPNVGELSEVQLYNTDNLEGEGQSHLSKEHQDEIITHAKEILEEEYAQFYRWYISLSAIPTLTELRSKVESIRRSQLASYRSLSETDSRQFDKMSRGLVNKILHEPMVRLRTAGNTPEEIASKAEVLGHLFNLPV